MRKSGQKLWLFLSLTFCSGFINSPVSAVFSGDTPLAVRGGLSPAIVGKAIQTTDPASLNNGTYLYDHDVTLAEEISAEAIWFGLGDVVTIAT